MIQTHQVYNIKYMQKKKEKRKAVQHLNGSVMNEAKSC